MKHSAAALGNARIALISESHSRQEEGAVSSYCEAVNYLLATYAPEDVIGKTDADVMRFTKPPHKSPTQYTEALWNKALR